MTNPLLDYRALLLARLEAVVPDIADTVAAIPPAQWHQPLRPGGRSPHLIVAHLRDVERHAYIIRLKRLLAEESPVFELFDPPNWETEYYNPQEPMATLLADYAAMRAQELAQLRSLTPADWARQGRHTTLGVHTLQWWVERTLTNAEDRLRELRTLI